MVVLDFGSEKDTTLTSQLKKQALIKNNSNKAKIESAFNFCCDCYIESTKMSCMPPAMFMAKKVRENDEKLVLARIKNGDGPSSQQYFNTKLMELSPLKYNSKLMNSIWGLYNRYSPHNIKRTNDDLFNSFGGLQESASLQRSAAPRDAAPLGKSPPKQGQNLPKIENIWSNIPISQSH